MKKSMLSVLREELASKTLRQALIGYYLFMGIAMVCGALDNQPGGLKEAIDIGIEVLFFLPVAVILGIGCSGLP